MPCNLAPFTPQLWIHLCPPPLHRPLPPYVPASVQRQVDNFQDLLQTRIMFVGGHIP